MANITTGTVQVVLSANSDKFIRGMKSAGDALKESEKSFSSYASNLVSMRNVAVAAGAAISGIAVAGYRYASMLDDMGDATGLTTAQLVQLETAAIRAGVAFEPMAQATTRLNATLGDARAGNESAIKSFERIGVSLDDLASASTYQRLLMVGDAIGNIADQSDRASAAREIFGKDSARFLGLLEGFSKNVADAAKNDSATVNDAAASIESATSRLAEAWQSIKVDSMIAMGNLAKMTGIAKPVEQKKGEEIKGDWIKSWGVPQFNASSSNATDWQAYLQRLAEENDRQKKADEWAKETARNNADRNAQERKDEKLIADMRAKSRQDMEEMNDALERMRVARMDGWGQEADAYAKRTEAIKNARNLIGNTKALEAAEQASTREHLAAVDKLFSDSLNKRAEGIKKWWNDQIKAAEDAAQKRAEAEQKAVDAVTNDPRLEGLRRSTSMVGATPEEKALAEREAAARNAFAADIKDPTKDPRLVAEITVNELIEVERERHAAALREQEKQDTQLRLNAYSDFFGNLDTLTKDAAEKSREAFYVNKAVQIAQAEINAWMAYSTIMAVESKLGATTAQVMAATALAAGQMAVAQIAAQEPPGRAAGGPVSAGGLYRVNEKGPELLTVGGRDYLMMGSRGGSVTPNGGTAPGGGRVTVNVINNASGTSARTEESGTGDDRTISVIIDRVERAMAGSVANGSGPLPRAMQSTYGLNRSRGAV